MTLGLRLVPTPVALFKKRLRSLCDRSGVLGEVGVIGRLGDTEPDGLGTHFGDQPVAGVDNIAIKLSRLVPITEDLHLSPLKDLQ